jgi:hypothetical protein
MYLSAIRKLMMSNNEEIIKYTNYFADKQG